MNVDGCKTLIKCNCGSGSHCSGYMGISKSNLQKVLEDRGYSSKENF